MPVSKKEFEKLKESHDHLESMVVQLVMRVQELEKKNEPKYFG
ncbi:hypothetical protein [Paraliobacillus ryukyuensis]|nr:hypothetical protein [Paraliobacillus ryukyuensis]